MLHQRSPGYRAADIGSWFHILRFISVVSVTTNCVFSAFYSVAVDRWMFGYASDIDASREIEDKQKTYARLIFIFVWHMVVYVVTIAISYAIPDIPQQVKVAQARQDFLEKVGFATSFLQLLNSKLRLLSKKKQKNIE
ncbi:hypothetical protein HK096_007173 [Nowakowskiella sp. JEL0078]|nr:hypothetical protein HK096_007173 [Nowakowskiella sp. JEL0078]